MEVSQVFSRAAPPPIFGFGYEAGANRIPLDVRECRPSVRRLRRTGEKTGFAKGTRTHCGGCAASELNRCASVRGLGKTGFPLRNSDQANMIAHQTEADDAPFIFNAVSTSEVPGRKRFLASMLVQVKPNIR